MQLTATVAGTVSDRCQLNGIILMIKDLRGHKTNLSIRHCELCIYKNLNDSLSF